jgi:hypothetical protein
MPSPGGRVTETAHSDSVRIRSRQHPLVMVKARSSITEFGKPDLQSLHRGQKLGPNRPQVFSGTQPMHEAKPEEEKNRS